MENEEYLEHFGIPGMHWRHRKGPSTISKKVVNSKPENSSDDHKNSVKLKGKKLNEMSNVELRTLNERMQLERQFKDLKKAQINPGKKYVTDLLSSTGKQVAAQYIMKYTAKGIEYLIKQAAKGKK